jgi:hypothetical protein
MEAVHRLPVLHMDAASNGLTGFICGRRAPVPGCAYVNRSRFAQRFTEICWSTMLRAGRVEGVAARLQAGCRTAVRYVYDPVLLWIRCLHASCQYGGTTMVGWRAGLVGRSSREVATSNLPCFHSLKNSPDMRERPARLKILNVFTMSPQVVPGTCPSVNDALVQQSADVVEQPRSRGPLASARCTKRLTLASSSMEPACRRRRWSALQQAQAAAQGFSAPPSGRTGPVHLRPPGQNSTAIASRRCLRPWSP